MVIYRVDDEQRRINEQITVPKFRMEGKSKCNTIGTNKEKIQK